MVPLDSNGYRVYADLREYLQMLEEHGKLKRISRPVDKDWEIAAVGRVNFQSVPEEQRCALLATCKRGLGLVLSGQPEAPPPRSTKSRCPKPAALSMK